MSATARPVAAVMLAVTLLLAQTASSELPPEGRCPDFTGAPGDTGEVDTGTPLVKEGAHLDLADLLSLRQLLPEEIWNYREAFFYEGMQMTIGFCHRRYPVADFYRDATETFRGRAKLDDEGNLTDYHAGLPFPPDSIETGRQDAAVRWAWNFEHRYRGSGPIGTFRLTDMPSRIGTPQTYEGTWHFLRTGHRSDLVASDYRVAESTKTEWVAGGRFLEPTNARHLAWRQARPRKASTDYTEPDDIFVYVPDLRKPRRAASTWTDGLYTPRYSVSGVEGGGGSTPFGTSAGSEYSPGGIEAIAPTAGLLLAATEDIRKGFTGMALRPNAYDWTLLGMQEVLAPLNGRAEGWPGVADRNYGHTGLSVASDRWDVRYAVVVRGRSRRVIDHVAAVTLWIDYQTQQPLYFISQRKNGFLLDIGILVHRFSGDRASYPAWPGGERARVFDPVAASFYYVPGGGAGWRRESYDVQSIPVDPGKMRKLTSTDELMKGR
ncbi:MAG: DUF1329 domain-containing protein [bacterium]|nr:DUF1329 domain-containing protein [bacterium]